MKYPGERDRERGARQALQTARLIEMAGVHTTSETIHGLAWELAKLQAPARAWRRHQEALASGPQAGPGITGEAWRALCLEHEERHEAAASRAEARIRAIHRDLGHGLQLCLGLGVSLALEEGGNRVWIS